MKKSWIIIIIVILIIATTIIGSIIVLKLVNKGESKDNNLNGMYNENLSNDGGNDITFICSEDLYNCEGFDNQLDAQNTYDYCKRILENQTTSNIDPHHLDSDSDGIACEGLE